jgi:hypothetical protein
MAFVFFSSFFSGNGKWLTRTTPSPDSSVSGPSSHIKGKGPSEDSAEEMALDEVFDFIGLNLRYGSAINFSV